MKRWLALVLWLAPCSGCMLMDELMYDGPPANYAQVQTPTDRCSVATGIVNTSQTVEPEMLKR